MNNNLHAQNQSIHINKRAEERLGIKFNRHQAYDIINAIAGKPSTYVVKYAGKASYANRSWYYTYIQNKKAYVLYDPSTKRLVTILDYNTKPLDVIKEELKNQKNQLEANEQEINKHKKLIEKKIKQIEIINNNIISLEKEIIDYNKEEHKDEL